MTTACSSPTAPHPDPHTGPHPANLPTPGAVDQVRVLHADEALLVADKPAGLLAVPGRGEAGQHHLLGHLQKQWPDAQVVHRLDMATSGLIVFARGPDMQRRLSALFAERQVSKHYEAVVHGHLQAPQGRIDLPLGPDWPQRPRQRVDTEAGKPSLTVWRVMSRSGCIDTGDARTRLALQPVTGRSHQLRVHLLALGHRIVGDTLYADDAQAERQTCSRLLLHACRLGLVHPASGEAFEFTSPAPF